MNETPTASYSLTIRARIPDQPGMFAQVAQVIGESGGNLGAIDLVDVKQGYKVRDITVSVGNEEQESAVAEAIRKVPGVYVLSVSDRTFHLHEGGKIEVRCKRPLKTRDDLSMAYTPGVARVCNAIARNPDEVYRLTIKSNTIAIVTDGTAILGLGDLGPEAALPVMEGKAMLFKEFGGVDAFPICLNTKDVDEIVRTVKNIAPVFGGINLEDISGPRCFEVEQRLQNELDIPVFHDDQHGTAVVALAALINALKIVDKPLDRIKVVICGAGAAGTAITKILLHEGVSNLVVCDIKGVLSHRNTAGLNPMQRWLAENTNPNLEEGSVHEAIAGADVFIGVSAANLLTVNDIRRMNRDAIVFALANPVPEIMPEVAAPFVRVMATGRSDYPNQINNVLCFPGLFRGVLDCRARSINEEMKIAAAHAIAQTVGENEISEDYIIPSVFNKKAVSAVSRAVIQAAILTGAGRETGESSNEALPAYAE